LEKHFPFRGSVFFRHTVSSTFLVGGFNPSEKFKSKWESSPNTGENKKSLKPPAHPFVTGWFHEFVQTHSSSKSPHGPNQELGVEERTLGKFFGGKQLTPRSNSVEFGPFKKKEYPPVN